MWFKIQVSFLYIIIFCSLFGCKPVQKGSESTLIHPEEQDLTQRAIDYADSVLTLLTLEERVGQCLMPSIYASDDASTKALLKRYIDDYHIGGIVLLQGTKEATLRLNHVAENSKIPLFFAIDAEWGLGMRLTDAPVYPKNGDISKDIPESELYDYGRRVGQESRELGINMVLGPVVDIAGVKNGVIRNRSFGEDPVLVSDYGVAYAKGLESMGVVSVAKHFPGHGSTYMDSHKGVASLNRNISSLDSIDLRPFKAYIDAGLTGVMAGHIQSLALDPDGNPASVSMDMLTLLLRDEMAFEGLILTDAFDMGGARGFTASDALKAGADIILCPADVAREYHEILKNIREGNIDLSLINERCKRILFVKYLFLD